MSRSSNRSLSRGWRCMSDRGHRNLSCRAPYRRLHSQQHRISPAQLCKLRDCSKANLGDRRGNFLHEKFDFLGHGFQARRSKNHWGKFFVNFSPGVSNAATKAIREEIRGWQLRCRIDRWIDDLARMFNPIIRGWITYYGRYYKSALYPALRYLDQGLAAWAMAKYKRLRRHRRRAQQWVCKTALRDPRLFAHWPLLHHAPTGR